MDFDEYYREAHPAEDHDPSYRWHPRNPIGTAYRFQLEPALLEALAVVDTPLEQAEILEVGSGSGRRLRFFVEIGASPHRVHGVELLESRVAQSRALHPGIDVLLGDAAEGIPHADGAFDLVTQFVALSSMLDHEIRRRVAAEMVRLTRPGGWLLTYDMVTPRPGQIPDGIPARHLAELFPGVEWRYRRRLHSLALARLAPWPLLAQLAEGLPWPRKTNVLWLGRKHP